jgi:pimeloyl-ACP methyl ester carboxylesterase
VENYLYNTAEGITVTELEKMWFFDGPGEEEALIFYPGAKVEATAYAPLLYQLAQAGIDCFLVEMPFRLAFLGMNRAEEIQENYDYEKWYLAGHSLGGAMAASYAADHPQDIDVLVLLAAYPTKSLAAEGLSVLSIYGSEDGVLNMDKVETGRQYMPENYMEICIEGGNHAQFGSYGEQKGDNAAAISRKEQILETVDYITNLF